MQNDSTLISVIIPVYNVEKYIDKCIDSVVNQTYKNLEIILVDDGSPDNCPEICDKWANKDGRIKVIHQENRGLAGARQSGVKAARGDYIAFVDSDDWIDFNAYERCVQMINTYQCDIVIMDFLREYPEKSVPANKQFDNNYYNKKDLINLVYPHMLEVVYANAWSKVIKREIIERYIFKVPENSRLGEDAGYTYSCLLAAKDLYFINECLYHYRVFPESMSFVYSEKLSDVYLNSYNILKDEFSKYDYDFSTSLENHLLHLVHQLVINEISAPYTLFSERERSILKSVIQNKDIVNAAKAVDKSCFSFHKKLLVLSLSTGNRFVFTITVSFLKAYLKMKKLKP